MGGVVFFFCFVCCLSLKGSTLDGQHLPENAFRLLAVAGDKGFKETNQVRGVRV